MIYDWDNIKIYDWDIIYQEIFFCSYEHIKKIFEKKWYIMTMSRLNYYIILSVEEALD